MRSRQSSDALETSDVEITRPDNGPPYDLTAPTRPWHVHLELRPEQLLTLHRLGFTGGALAWREGMDDWQPLRVGAEPEEELTRPASSPPPAEPAGSPPLAQVTSLSAHRRPHRNSENQPGLPKSPARVTPFAQARANVPPIANALPLPLVRLRRPPELATQSVVLEGRIPQAPLPSFAADALDPLPHSAPVFAARTAPNEPKPLSVPPITLESPASPPRSKASRVVVLGGAALVVLSASNGALVSALLWSLRHEPSATSGLSAASAEAQRAAPPLEAAPVPPSESAALARQAVSGAPAQPLSLEQLPLARATARSDEGPVNGGSNAAAGTPATHSSSRARATSSRRGAHRGPTAVVLDEEGSSSRARKPPRAAPPEEVGPVDRRAMSRAIGHAAGAASSCSPGPETGRVSVTFAASGNVQAVSLLKGFGDAGINACVMRAMGRAKVRPFSGEAITVQKTLNW